MYQKTVLPNGLRIVTKNIKDRHGIALGFWAGVGGRYEPDRLKGAAHFLEHIVFKGSKKYTCEQIKEKIEGVGGALNAFTSEEQTCFYAKFPATYLNQTFDVLADMVLFPTITKKDVTKEAGVIVEEIKMYHDLPQYYVMELLDGILWPEHPLGKSLAGTKETITNMTPQDLKEFHAKHYAPGNVVISACGKLSHKRIVDLAKAKLGKIKKQEEPAFDAADNSQATPRLKFHKRDIEQMHLAMGILGYDQYHKDRFGLSLLSTILGGNMSSRLFVEIREKRGLAYSIGCNAKALHDTGLLLIRAGVDTQKTVESVKLIIKELTKIQKEGISQSEFKRSKDYLLGQLMLGLEDSMDHMLWIGEGVVAKDEVRSLQSVIKQFDKIKRSDIKRIAKDILNPKRFNLALVGPTTDKDEREITKLLS